MIDQARATASEMAAAIAAGELTARAACEAAIARIEAGDGAINAVIIRDFDRARRDADAADARLAAGERAPLLGVPMTVKESYDLTGHPTSWGFAQHADNIATGDALVVQRLKAAGAVILGKTNVPVALADVQSFNPNYGRTNNPHALGRTCGGSSGGGAAALAAGFVPLEYGSDIGGSIRVPAHFCGVFGHKPTFGMVPHQGHDFPGTDGAARELSVRGPLARSAADLALALTLTSDGALAPARSATLAGQRLFVLTAHPIGAVNAATVAAIEAAAARAAAAGAIIVRDTDLLPDLARHHAGYMRMLNIIVSGGAPAPNGKVATLADWWGLQDEQARILRQWQVLFATVDAVLAPNFATPAFPHDDRPIHERTIDVDGQTLPFGDQFAWPGLAIYPGLPATSVPLVRDAAGLPIGMQVIGAPYSDLHMIALGGMLAGPCSIAA